MATEVERLIAVLEAKMTQYDRAMKKAVGDTDRTFKRIEDRGRMLEGRLAKLGIEAFKGFVSGGVAAVAGILSVGAAVEGTKAALQKFGDIADKSAAAGIDPEFFQSIAYQAQMAGVEIGEVAGALATYNKNAGLAAEGRGKLFSTLAAINPELLKSIQLATTQEQRIRLVADAIADAKNESEAAAIAAAAWGDAGVKMASAFKGGADEIDRVMAKAQALGIIVDREVIERADELGDEFDTVSLILDNNVKRSLVELGPVLAWLTGLAADWARKLNISIDRFKDTDDRTFIVSLQRDLDDIYVKMAPLREEIAALQRQIERRGEGSEFLSGLALDQKKQEMDALTQSAERLLERITQLQGKPPGPPVAKPTAAATPFNPNLLGDVGLSLLDLDLPDVPELDAVAEGFGRIAGSAATVPEVVWETDLAFEALQDRIGMTEDMAMSFVSSLVGGLRSGKSVADSLFDSVLDLADQLTQMALNQAISGLVGSLFAGGGQWAIPKGHVPGGFYPGLPGYAAGTADTGGRRGQPVGLVHGREAVIPLPNGGRVPVEVRGGAPRFTIHNYGAVVEPPRGSGNEFEITVRALARDEMASGRSNGIDQAKYGLRPTVRAR